MNTQDDAVGWAETQVAAARDDPAARLALLARTYRGPTGNAPRHVPFRRPALRVRPWQGRGGRPNPPQAPQPGSRWWRAANERLLRDGCEALALVGGHPGVASSAPVQLWLRFIEQPTPSRWYRAH